ncbi:membrane protein [Mycobacterium phage ScoobyDoobyDoo]|nr:membrane protein [Mycobacterium phage ScoobyDoobyDoo]
MTDRKASIIAGAMMVGLIIASVLTVGLFGTGAWGFVTADVIPAKRLSAGDRWVGVAVCLIPILMVVVIWAQLIAFSRYVKGDATQQRLAERYGVSRSMVSRIINGNRRS